MSTIAFRAARNQIRAYMAYRVASSQNGLIEEHREAMECHDCQDYLQVGIDAFRWLKKAHADICSAVQNGSIAYNDDLERALTQMYGGWLEPCAVAEQWVRLQESRGYTVDNMGAFIECRDEARDILEQRSLVHSARRARLHAPGGETW